jgi:centrosomal protein CEP164
MMMRYFRLLFPFKEILEYATWLGMDCDEDPDLLWIAKEGIKAPLPDDWKPCKSSSGSVYYFNIITGESK